MVTVKGFNTDSGRYQLDCLGKIFYTYMYMVWVEYPGMIQIVFQLTPNFLTEKTSNAEIEKKIESEALFRDFKTGISFKQSSRKMTAQLIFPRKKNNN